MNPKAAGASWQVTWQRMNCYIYCPYPTSFYPKGTNSFTVAAHPIDNDVENTGYRFEGKRMKEVKVNEEYADKYMVLLIMPKDEDKMV